MAAQDLFRAREKEEDSVPEEEKEKSLLHTAKRNIIIFICSIGIVPQFVDCPASSIDHGSLQIPAFEAEEVDKSILH